MRHTDCEYAFSQKRLFLMLSDHGIHEIHFLNNRECPSKGSGYQEVALDRGLTSNIMMPVERTPKAVVSPNV